MDRVLIFGSTGQLGADLVEVLQNSGSFDVIPLTHEDADCRHADAIRKIVLAYRPQIVINCAAYVRVDDCEDYPCEAFEVNAIGAFNIARASAGVDAQCVYISTDYIFDGEKNLPYVESDIPNPINVYGVSKLAGEFLVRQSAPRWLVVRVSSLFGKTGARGKGGNFIDTVVGKAKAGERLHMINDIAMSPTYARDAAVALAVILQNGVSGIFHVTNSGGCTWYDFAKAILEFTGLEAAIIPVSSNEFSSRARRPRVSRLRSERAPCDLRSWQEGVKAYLCEKGYLGK